MTNADLNMKFLRQVMPESGHIMVAPKVQHKGDWVDYRDPVVYHNIQKQYDARKADMYFSPASFTEKRRLISTALESRAIFLDIDAGEAKRAKHGDLVYRDRDEAKQALFDWLDLKHLPDPSWIVHSGCGLHVYWTVETAMTPDVWLALERGLLTSAASVGLKYDTQVGRVNNLLRVPGSTHRKSGNPVAISEDEGTHEPYRYSALAKAFPPVAEEDLPKRSRNSRQKNYTPVDLSARPAHLFTDDADDEWIDVGKPLEGEHKFNPASFEKLLHLSSKRVKKGCEFIRLAHEGSRYLGRGLWRAALSIAEHCEDRSTYIHKISRDHASYSALETEKVAEGTHGMPYTCDTIAAECAAFDMQMKATKGSTSGSEQDKAMLAEAKKLARNMGAACKACPHKVTTPLQLCEIVTIEVNTAQEYQEIKKKEARKALAHTVAELSDVDIRQTFEKICNRIVEISTPKPIMPDYVGIDQRSKKLIFSKTGDVIYDYPIYLVDRARDDRDGDVLTCHVDTPGDGMRVFSFPQELLANPQKLHSFLSRYGIMANEEGKKVLMSFLMNSCKLSHDTKARELRRNFGWQDDGRFIHGALEFGADTQIHPARVRGCDDLLAAMSPDVTANPLVWTEMAQKFTGEGFGPALFAIGLSAGAPLFRLGDMEGCLAHFCSTGSGTGKTTLVKLALTIWARTGASNKGSGLLALANDTARALLVRLGLLNSLPTGIDELSLRDEHELAFLIYSITQGRQPDRMESSTNTLRANTNTWDMPVLSTGNISILDKARKMGSIQDAQLARILELDCTNLPRLDLPMTVLKSELANLDNNHSGAVGRILAVDYANQADTLRHELREVQHSLLSDFNFTEKERYWSGMMVCAIVGLRMLRRRNLLQYDEQMFIDYFSGLLKQSRKAQKAAVVTPQDMVFDFLSSHMKSVLTVNDEDAFIAEHLMPDVISGKYVVETSRMYINKRELDTWLDANRYNATDVNKYLTSIGAKQQQVNLLPFTSNRESRVRCWVIPNYVMEGAEID